jgi:poly(3-hydroxybutyrate) depolymerase
MLRFLRLLIPCLVLASAAAPARALGPQPPQHAFGAFKAHREKQELPQETGFLNRRIDLHGVTYRFVVYLPEEWRRDDHHLWPIILALHGRGERGSEGLWQTQIGLPQQVRDHPDRWPFIIVMPQCPLDAVWTDPEMLAMAMAALDRETEEFHGDPERTYLTGLSLGGYGAWELARDNPQRWAAIAIVASGVFWSYEPERWQQAATLPGEYARPIGRTPVWLFHGADDPVVAPRESDLMYDALKASGGHVRLWIYQGLKHDSWTRAYNEPELPRWLLAHRAIPAAAPANAPASAEPAPMAERLVIPFHPPAVKLAPAVLDALTGEYTDKTGHTIVTVFRQGELLYEKNLQGEIAELGAETASIFFYVNGSSSTRLTFDHDPQGHVTALTLRDDRHEERWAKRLQPQVH